MKKLLSILSIFSFATSAIAGGPAPIKDIDITGSSSKISGGTFSIQTGVLFQALSGSTITFASASTFTASGAIDFSGATSFKVATLTTATNTNLVLDANGTGKLDIRDTVTTATDSNLVLDANGTGKLDIRDAVTTGTNGDFVLDPNGTGAIQLLAGTYVGSASTAPTAYLHIAAGVATAGGAPLKLTTGVVLTTPESGTINYDGSFFYGTNSTPTRQRFSTDANAAAIAASAIDWSLSAVHSKTLAANTTFTFSNTVDGRTIVVAVTNTASNYTVTWPTVSWSGGTAPVQTIGAKTDVYTFVKIGSTIYGSAVQNF